MLLKWDTALVLGEPPVEGLERGVEGSGNVEVACAAPELPYAVYQFLRVSGSKSSLKRALLRRTARIESSG